MSGRPPQIRAELTEIDLELDRLTHERTQHRIAGPIVMMSVGYGGAFILGLVATELALLGNSDGDFCDEDSFHDINDPEDCTLDADERRSLRIAARVTGPVAAVFAGLGVWGTIRLSDARRERAKHAPEINALKLRRRDLIRELQYGFEATNDGGRLALRGSWL